MERLSETHSTQVPLETPEKPQQPLSAISSLFLEDDDLTGYIDFGSPSEDADDEVVQQIDDEAKQIKSWLEA